MFHKPCPLIQNNSICISYITRAQWSYSENLTLIEYCPPTSCSHTSYANCTNSCTFRSRVSECIFSFLLLQEALSLSLMTLTFLFCFGNSPSMWALGCFLIIRLAVTFLVGMLPKGILSFSVNHVREHMISIYLVVSANFGVCMHFLTF